MNFTYKVEVVHDESGEVVTSFVCGSSLRAAEKMLNAVSINLNHCKYSAYIRKVESKND